MIEALGPKALEGTRWAYPVAAVAILAIFALYWVDVHSPINVTVGALAVLPVLAAAWLLDGRLTSVVTAVAIGSRIVVAYQGGLTPITAGSQGIVLPLVAAAGHLAARGLLAARRGREHEREVRDLSFLVTTSQAIAASLDLDNILASATQAVAQVVHRGGQGGPARAAFHQLLEDDRLRIAYDFDEAGSRSAEGEYPMAWNRAAVRAAKSGQIEVVGADDLAPELAELAGREHWQAGAIVPVRAAGRLHGMMIATARDHDFTTEELHLVEVVAQMTGLAIGHAEMFRRERDEAERAGDLERTKAEFLRLASHELRGPLTVVRGYLSMLLDGSVGNPDPTTTRMLDTVQGKVSEMDRLITQMLEAARLEEARPMLKLERFDLGDVIEEAIRRMAPLDPEGRVRLEPPATELPVEADRERLLTILTNLIGNALKYSPDGGEVTISTAALDGRLKTMVADRGIGIATRDLPSLFTRFGRVVPEQYATIAGTGLGLYLSRELARLVGGDVTIESELGRGSTFTLDLPAAA